MTTEDWEQSLADCLAPLVTIGSTKQQHWFAEYATGRCILQMQEHLNTKQWHCLLAKRGITPYMQRDYIQTFLAEVRKFVKAELP